MIMSLSIFFTIVVGAVVISAIAGVIFGLRRDYDVVIDPHIDNSDHLLDSVITKDFEIPYED